jgi:hypothetical protein
MSKMTLVSSPALTLPSPFLSAATQPPGTAWQPVAIALQFRIVAMILVSSPAVTLPSLLQSPRHELEAGVTVRVDVAGGVPAVGVGTDVLVDV